MLLVKLDVTLAITMEEIQSILKGNRDDIHKDEHLISEIIEGICCAANKLPLENIES